VQNRPAIDLVSKELEIEGAYKRNPSDPIAADFLGFFAPVLLEAIKFGDGGIELPCPRT